MKHQGNYFDDEIHFLVKMTTVNDFTLRSAFFLFFLSFLFLSSFFVVAVKTDDSYLTLTITSTALLRRKDKDLTPADQ